MDVFYTGLLNKYWNHTKNRLQCYFTMLIKSSKNSPGGSPKEIYILLAIHQVTLKDLSVLITDYM